MGEKLFFDFSNNLIVPDNLVIPYIVGDGIGKEIWPAVKLVVNAAVKTAYDSKKRIYWKEVFLEQGTRERPGGQPGERICEDALAILEKYKVAIKGPLTVPESNEALSPNYTIKKQLKLFASARKIKYYPTIPNPFHNPEKVNIILFWENDLGSSQSSEASSFSPETMKHLGFLKTELFCDIPPKSSLGARENPRKGSNRLLIKAFEYALRDESKSITLMRNSTSMDLALPKNQISRTGFDILHERFGSSVVSEEAVFERYEGLVPDGKVSVKERMADMVFAEMLLRPEHFDVIVCPNNRRDWLAENPEKDFGVGMMNPMVSIGNQCAVFEPNHGTAMDIAGQDKANPCAIILAGAMMLGYIGWKKAAQIIEFGVKKSLAAKEVPLDLAVRIPGKEEVSCSRFSRIIAEKILFQA
ncbi:MAG: NADP-dependent isocitrate dehydrogenase [Desulfobacteraceae bacterium]|nr:NADP-dependent isocitrate dehydrogenase [Desulfobacteraceae bacterium]